MRNNAEAKIQAAIVKRLRRAGYLVHSIANEAAGSNAVRQGQLITMGLLPGVADLLAWSPTGWPTYVEVKAPGGKQSPAQERFEARCAEIGIPYRLVYSLADAEAIFGLDAKPT